MNDDFVGKILERMDCHRFASSLFDVFRKWVQKKQTKHEPSTPKHVDLMLDIDLMNLLPVISSSAGVQDMSYESKSKPVPENPSFEKSPS